MRARNRTIVICAVLLTFLTAAIGHANLSDGLVAWYPFNGSADDESGQGHHGTVYGEVLTADPFGNPDSAYLFDGEDDYIEVPNTDDAFNLYEWTVSAWCKPLTSLSAGTSGPVVWKTSIPNRNFDTFGLAWQPGNRWILKLERASDGEDVVIYSSTYTPGSWHLVTGTYDGQNISIYVDGELDDSRYVGEIIAYTGDESLMIGSTMNTNHGDRGVHNGPIDEVYIYNRALSDTEVGMLAGIPTVAAIDIHPDLFEVKVDPNHEAEEPEEGFLTAFIELPVDVNVSEVDVNTVIMSLNDIVLATAESPEIVDDILIVNFRLNLQNVSKLIGSEVVEVDIDRGERIEVITTTGPSKGIDLVKLAISGELTDGSSFSGTDAIRMVPEDSGGEGKTIADVNADGVVNFLDFSLLVNQWLKSGV